MITLVVSVLLAFITSVSLTPVVLFFARRSGLVDAAGISHRKVHAEDIPRLGGIAIVIAFYVPLIGLMAYETFIGNMVVGNQQIVTALLGGGLVIALLGLYDDLRDASPKLKLIVQIAVALGVTALGFQIDKVDLPFIRQLQLGWLAWPVTVLWIVGITNAVNLIDGLDGLAAGIALFGLAPMTILAMTHGNMVGALICLTLSGSVLGFLVYNFHPARIFMGDTGSMFLGYILAVTTIYTSTKGETAVVMLTPILALGLPILDTLLALVRRAVLGQSLFVGDRQHIHHRLLETGLSHRTTVLVMYGFAALFASLALATRLNRDLPSGIILAMSVLAAGILLRKVGYLSMPSNLGNEVQVAAALRERNQLLKSQFPALESAIDRSRSLENAIAGASGLARLVVAQRAVLDLRPAFPHEAVRTWQWGETSDEPSRLSFPLQDENRNVLGELTLEWSSAREVGEGVIQITERGCSQLAARLADAHELTLASEISVSS
jgi:UDP-GlcNAc:undecaprenyl-phosphate GlcNAc-1-phosphate transferase